MIQLRAYVVTAVRKEILPEGQEIGYRSKLVAAANEDEAVGRTIREWSSEEPNAAFSHPTFIPISAGKLASLGVDMTPFKEITP